MAEPTPPASDPSMEDILASIRRILNEDEAPKAAVGSADGVLQLDESMMVGAPTPPPPPPLPSPEQTPVAVAMPLAIPEITQAAPTTDVAVATADVAVATADVAVVTGESVASLLRRLVANREPVVVHRGGPTIEDMVREEIRPLLQAWLDANLPSLVERHVRLEIERVVGRAIP